MKLRPKLYTLLKNRRQEFTRKNIIKDITSGLVVACIALPLSIALAIASGVMPANGLITAVVAGLAISLLGGSRVQIAGADGRVCRHCLRHNTAIWFGRAFGIHLSGRFPACADGLFKVWQLS